MSEKEQGNIINPFNLNVTTDSGPAFIIQIKDKENSRVYVDSYYDTHYYQDGKQLSMISIKGEYETGLLRYGCQY